MIDTDKWVDGLKISAAQDDLLLNDTIERNDMKHFLQLQRFSLYSCLAKSITQKTSMQNEIDWRNIHKSNVSNHKYK